jgi:1-acyl-sn-glycerol-3-phosphate acyltransferase
MKEALGLDPALGLFGRRVPNALIDQDDERACDAVERLAGGLERRAALLLFPEGGNFTPQRRRSAIAWLRRHGQSERARRAVELEYLISPRAGGVRAALAGAPLADVVFAAHTGLGPGAKGIELLRNLPRDSSVLMRFWLAPAAERPSGEDELLAWLDAWWEVLDTWIEDLGREQRDD